MKKIIFMGTPDFAVSSIEKIASSDHVIQAVVTQPDRQRGRGRKILPSPAKLCALKLGIPVLQPEKVREESFLKIIKELAPDLIVVVAFGQILPLELLNIPHEGCVNLHGSLLPAYRGAAPIQRAVMNGDEITGVTTILMNEKMDEGDILLKSKVKIESEDTAGKLFEKLKETGANLLIKTIDGMEHGKIESVSQDKESATYAHKITKEESLIDWSLPKKEIHNHVRGLFPSPGAFTFLNGKRFIISSTGMENETDGNPGEVQKVSKEGIHVFTGSGVILIKRLQPEGKREMAAANFTAGHNIKAGTVFGK